MISIDQYKNERRNTQGKTMHTRVCVALVALAVMLNFWSCSNDEVYPGQFYTIENAEWKYGKVLKFNDNHDTLPGVLEAVAISVRHTNEYPYGNLWLELSYKSQDSLVRDTVNIRLANEYGKWNGSGSGPVVTYTDTMHTRKVPDEGTIFMLRHIMRADVVPELEQIGLAFQTIPGTRRQKTEILATDSLSTNKANDK